jgi:hypothetical protein
MGSIAVIYIGTTSRTHHVIIHIAVAKTLVPMEPSLAVKSIRRKKEGPIINPTCFERFISGG